MSWPRTGSEALIVKKSFILLIAIPVFINFGGLSFSQESNDQSAKKEEAQTENVAQMQQAFEKAMRQIAADKEKEEAKTLVMLKEKLSVAAHGWISTEMKKREGGLNKFVEQNWEILIKFGDPAHYDYYLRDFAYAQGASDIIKTDSLTTPYRAVVNVTERLYVERYHTPDASDVTMFFYTFTNPMKVYFEYNDNRFVFASTEIGDVHLDQGWPREIKALWDKYGERFRTAAR